MKKRRGSRGILDDANKKAREILSEGLPLDSFKVERNKILSDAQEEVKHRIEESRKASAGMPISFFRKGGRVLPNDGGSGSGNQAVTVSGNSL